MARLFRRRRGLRSKTIKSTKFIELGGMEQVEKLRILKALAEGQRVTICIQNKTPPVVAGMVSAKLVTWKQVNDVTDELMLTEIGLSYYNDHKDQHEDNEVPTEGNA